MASDVTKLTVCTYEGAMLTVDGREAWALHALLELGETGVTPINRPAPRWSHYVWLLRARGLAIDTINERHGGPYPGRHGRYVLRTPLKVVAVTREGDSRDAA